MGFEAVEERLDKKDKFLAVQIAPAIRVSLGEEFGFEAGAALTGQIVSALRKLGFDAVFDTSFGADVVVMEEAEDLLERMHEKNKTPVLSSCCPGFVAYIEHAYPELVDDLCTGKSPMEMIGALIKTYYAEKKSIKAKDIYSVSIMPCMVKKAEAKRPELKLNGMQVIDHVLTTRELAALMKKKKVNLRKMKSSDFDSLLGHASGAGQIFGVTGGIAEAVFRRLATKHAAAGKKIEFKQVRGLKGVKEGKIKVGRRNYRWAVVNGIRSLPAIFESKSKLKKYDFIEVMFCYGGCIGGAGQPSTNKEKIRKRKQGLYSIDRREPIWATDINPEIQALYSDFLGKPGSKKAKKLLHTTFHKYYEH